MKMQRLDVRSSSGKAYRIELEAIGTGPIAAVELSAWFPRKLGRDLLLYVNYPYSTIHAASPGSTEEWARESLKLRDALAARIKREPEAAWRMDRPALLRASDALVIALGENYEAFLTVEGGAFISDDTALDYIGRGNRMAVHRAGLATSK